MSSFGFLSALFETENKVDPVVQVLRHVFGLECFSVDSDELIRRAFRPWREPNIVDLSSRLSSAEREYESGLGVDRHFRHHIDFFASLAIIQAVGRQQNFTLNKCL